MTTRAKCSSCAASEAKVHEQQEEIERLKRGTHETSTDTGRPIASRRADVLGADVPAPVRAGASGRSAVDELASLRARIGELEQEMREWCDPNGNVPDGDDELALVTRWADQLAALLASSGVQKQEAEEDSRETLRDA